MSYRSILITQEHYDYYSSTSSVILIFLDILFKLLYLIDLLGLL